MSYLLINEKGNIQIENEADRLPRYLTKDWTVYELVLTDGIPSIGGEVELGTNQVTARTTTHQVMLGGEVIGEGAVSEAVNQ